VKLALVCERRVLGGLEEAVRSTAGEPPAAGRRGHLTGAGRLFGQERALWVLGTPANQIHLDAEAHPPSVSQRYSDLFFTS